MGGRRDGGKPERGRRIVDAAEVIGEKGKESKYALAGTWEDVYLHVLDRGY